MINRFGIVLFIIFVMSSFRSYSHGKDTLITYQKVSSAIDSLKKTELYKTAEAKLKEYSPEIKKALKNNLKKVSQKTLENDKLMRQIFKKSYPFLPLTIRMFVDEQLFVEFCMDNRELLVEVTK